MARPEATRRNTRVGGEERAFDTTALADVRLEADGQTPYEVANYIAQLTSEMAGMARAAKLELLAYFLEMARIEATTSVRRSRSQR